MFVVDTNILIYYLAIIAATAWHLGLPLLTHDHGFVKIKEIEVVDPMS